MTRQGRRLALTEKALATVIRMTALWFMLDDEPLLREWAMRFGVFCLWMYVGLLLLTFWVEW